MLNHYSGPSINLCVLNFALLCPHAARDYGPGDGVPTSGDGATTSLLAQTAASLRRYLAREGHASFDRTGEPWFVVLWSSFRKIQLGACPLQTAFP